MILKFEFTQEQANLLLEGAQNLPYKVASPLIAELIKQANNQPAPPLVSPAPEKLRKRPTKAIAQFLNSLPNLDNAMQELEKVFPDHEKSTLNTQLNSFEFYKGRGEI